MHLLIFFLLILGIVLDKSEVMVAIFDVRQGYQTEYWKMTIQGSGQGPLHH
jgi:hypothetical protein